MIPSHSKTNSLLLSAQTARGAQICSEIRTERDRKKKRKYVFNYIWRAINSEIMSKQAPCRRSARQLKRLSDIICHSSGRKRKTITSRRAFVRKHLRIRMIYSSHVPFGERIGIARRCNSGLRLVEAPLICPAYRTLGAGEQNLSINSFLCNRLPTNTQKLRRIGECYLKRDYRGFVSGGEKNFWPRIDFQLMFHRFELNCLPSK